MTQYTSINTCLKANVYVVSSCSPLMVNLRAFKSLTAGPPPGAGSTSNWILCFAFRIWSGVSCGDVDLGSKLTDAVAVKPFVALRTAEELVLFSVFVSD